MNEIEQLMLKEDIRKAGLRGKEALEMFIAVKVARELESKDK